MFIGLYFGPLRGDLIKPSASRGGDDSNALSLLIGVFSLDAAGMDFV
jgi:hypothetical protein